jgi:hypothetical protein
LPIYNLLPTFEKNYPMNSPSRPITPSTPLGVTPPLRPFSLLPTLKLTLTLTLTLLLFSCKGVDDIRMTGVSDFAFRSMENNTITFSARVGVYNPSSVGFRVTDMNIKTLVDGNFIGTLSTPDRLKIRARSDSSYQMTFTLTMANMLTGASSLYSLARKKKVNVDLQGSITARSWLNKHTTEIRESRTIDVPSFNR